MASDWQLRVERNARLVPYLWGMFKTFPKVKVGANCTNWDGAPNSIAFVCHTHGYMGSWMDRPHYKNTYCCRPRIGMLGYSGMYQRIDLKCFADSWFMNREQLLTCYNRGELCPVW